MNKICKQKDDICIYYYVKDKDEKLVTYGMLCKEQQIETAQPVFSQSTDINIFNDIFSSWEMVEGEIIGVEK